MSTIFVVEGWWKQHLKGIITKKCFKEIILNTLKKLIKNLEFTPASVQESVLAVTNRWWVIVLRL